MSMYGLPASYDSWRTASPPEGDACPRCDWGPDDCACPPCPTCDEKPLVCEFEGCEQWPQGERCCGETPKAECPCDLPEGKGPGMCPPDPSPSWLKGYADGRRWARGKGPAQPWPPTNPVDWEDGFDIGKAAKK